MLAWLIRIRRGTDRALCGKSTTFIKLLNSFAIWPISSRRFSIAIHGAALVYNLLLARKSDRSDLIDE